MNEPRYWMHETSGVLRPAVESYLHREPLTAEQIAALRAYFRQWIGSPVWDLVGDHAWLARMRAEIDGLTSRAAIERWLDDAEAAGMDPL